MPQTYEQVFFATRNPSPVAQAVVESHNKGEFDVARLAHLNRIAQAWNAYQGEFDPTLPKDPEGIDDEVVINYARLIVDKSTAFLFGMPITFELDKRDNGTIDDEDSTTDTPEEEWLRKCLRANKIESTLNKLATNGGVTGHAFIKVLPESRLTEGYPRLVVLDPATVDYETNPEDCEDVIEYTISWEAKNDQGKAVRRLQEIELNQDGNSWTITDYEVDLQTQHKMQLGEPDIWNYSWPPIFQCQNLTAANTFWGTSDLEDDIIGLNTSLNSAVSKINRILRFHAHPKTWGKGFTADQLDTTSDKTVILPNPDATLQNLEMKSDLGSSIEFYRAVKDSLHETSRTPKVSTGMVEASGQIAGVAIMILFQPLVEKTRVKRNTYGPMLQDLARRLLELGNFGPDNHVIIRWPQILPRDELQERQTAQYDRALGVSQETVLQQLGYDPKVEAAKSKNDREPAAMGASPANTALSPSRTGTTPFQSNNTAGGGDGSNATSTGNGNHR